MLALLYPEYDRLAIAEVPEPQPGPGEVIVEVAACGICGSELGGFAARSPRRQPPLVMGHEFCGRVAALGGGVDGVGVGDRVVVNSVVHCGECALCRRGATHLCQSRQVFGMHRPGAFAERVAVPAGILFPLPPEVSDLQGAMAEPLANALHVLSLAPGNPLESVLVLGAGTIGLLCMQAARAAGTRRVLITDTNAHRLSVARALGANEVADPSAASIVDLARTHSDGLGVDLAIDAVGTPDARRDAIRSVRPGGDVVWIGLHDDEVTLSSFEVVLAERRVSGSYGATDRDIRRAIDLFAAGAIRLDPWVEEHPLSRGDRIFIEMLRQERDAVKAVLLP
jgi:L-iditol 2-dehydrogenase